MPWTPKGTAVAVAGQPKRTAWKRTSHHTSASGRGKTRQDTCLSERIVGRLLLCGSRVRAQLHGAPVPVRVQQTLAHTSTAVLDDPLDAHGGQETEQSSHMSTIDSRNTSQSTRSSASVMRSFHSCCCCATHSHHSRDVFPATPITTSAVWTLLRAVTSTEHGEDLPPQACRARGSTVWTEHGGEDSGAGAG